MSRSLTIEKMLVAATVLVLLVATFAHTFVLFVQGWHDEENMHGVAVAPIVAFLIWMNWKRLRSVPIHPAIKLGAVVLAIALFIEVAGIWLGLERSIGYSFVLAVVGLCLYFLGTKMVRELAFPLVFLVFMVPTPGGVLDMVSAPLQVLSARCAVLLSGLSGVVVHNEGVNLLIPAKHIAFEVAVACSGIHSLTAMCMLAALMVYFINVPIVCKWLLFALAVPLALAGNIVRIYLVLMVANRYGQSAGSAFHDGMIAKLVPFTVAFLVLIGLGRLIEWRLGAAHDKEVAI